MFTVLVSKHHLAARIACARRARTTAGGRLTRTRPSTTPAHVSEHRSVSCPDDVLEASNCGAMSSVADPKTLESSAAASTEARSGERLTTSKLGEYLGERRPAIVLVSAPGEADKHKETKTLWYSNLSGGRRPHRIPPLLGNQPQTFLLFPNESWRQHGCGASSPPGET